MWQEERGIFRRGRAAVILTALRNNGGRTLNKFAAGSNTLTVCRFHNVYGHSCQGHRDSSMVAITSRGGFVFILAMLRLDGCSPPLLGNLES